MRKQKNPFAPDKQCYFCRMNIKHVDYKDVDTLRRYMSSFGKIVARKRSGVCSSHQRMLSTGVKRARFMSLVPYSVK
ncbi:MAG: 30S ribosomal protein S18 [bacterium]